MYTCTNIDTASEGKLKDVKIKLAVRPTYGNPVNLCNVMVIKIF